MSASRKTVAVVAAVGGVLIAVCVCLYFASTWVTDLALGARIDKGKLVDEKEKTARPEPERVKAKEFRHDKPAEVAGFKIELLRGSVTKLERMPFGKATLTKDEHYRIDVRFTSLADGAYYQGFSAPFPELSDGHGKQYRYAFVRKEFTQEQRKLAKGSSLEDSIAFELAGDNAKEFRLEMDCRMIGKEDVSIAFKIPREFFKGK